MSDTFALLSGPAETIRALKEDFVVVDKTDHATRVLCECCLCQILLQLVHRDNSIKESLFRILDIQKC